MSCRRFRPQPEQNRDLERKSKSALKLEGTNPRAAWASEEDESRNVVGREAEERKGKEKKGRGSRKPWLLWGMAVTERQCGQNTTHPFVAS